MLFFIAVKMAVSLSFEQTDYQNKSIKLLWEKVGVYTSLEADTPVL